MNRFGVNFLACVFLFVFLVAPAQAKFRNSLNFRDNNFVAMNNTELTHRYQEFSDCDSDTLDRTELTYQLTYGIFTNFEVGMSFPIIFYEDAESGLGDVQVYQKFKFTEESGALPTSSGGFELILPTGDESATPPFGSDKLDARFFLTLGQDFGEDWRWLTNGAVRFFGDESHEDKYEFNGALTYQPGSRLKTMLELNGHSGGYQDLSEIYLAPGLNIRPKDNFSFQLTFPVGVSDEAADYKTAFQFAVNF